MTRAELDELRLGWDLLIDLDSNELAHSKIAADVCLSALEAHGLRDIPIKFSGRAGFHILIPSKLFPVEWGGKPMNQQFPDLPRKIAVYFQDFIKDVFATHLSTAIGEPVEDPFKFVKIDSALVTSRHLVRCPYSFHEKTWLVSLPIKRHDVLTFDPETARPENVKEVVFFEGGTGSATDIIERAVYFTEEKERERRENEPDKPKITFTGKRDGKVFRVPPEAFPPCVKNILEQKDITDCRKRRMGFLQAYLMQAGRSAQEMSDEILTWNASLKNPLPSQYVTSQIKSHAKKTKPLMPPNCGNEEMVRVTGVCTPDGLCNGLKNPIQYSYKRFKAFRRNPEKKRRQKK